MIRKLFLIFVGMLLLCGCVSATDYYVSTTGNNSDAGGIDTPWATPSYAATQVAAGDVIYLRGGTWSGDVIDFSTSGTAENHISMRAYEDETPILSGAVENYVTDDVIYIPVGVDYIDVSGITIQDYNYTNGVFCNGNYCTISDCIIDNIGYNTSTTVGSGSAITIRGSHVTVENCTMNSTGWNLLQINFNTGGPNVTDVRVSNCSLSYSKAHGLLDLFNSLIDENYYLQNISIIGNHFAGYPGQTAVFPHGAAPYWMENITFSGNTLSTGGIGINSEYFRNSLVSDNIFSGFSNYAIGSGGSVKTRNGTVYRNNTVLDSSAKSFNCFVGETVTFDQENITGFTVKYGNFTIQNHQRNTYSVILSYGSPTIFAYTNGRVFTASTATNIAYFDRDGATSYTPSGSSEYWCPRSTYSTNVNILAYNYSAVPAAETATITPNTPTGTEIANFTAESTNGNLVTFTAWELTPGAQYRIKEDGSEKSTQIANATGYITWNNSIWSEHIYTVEDTGLRLSLPVCAFTANVTSGTAPETVQFTDASTQNPETWSWDFNGDDVEDSTEQNPVWTYDTDGSYDVSLTVTNAIGSDTELKEDYIILTNPYVAPIILTTVAAALLFMRARRRW